MNTVEVTLTRQVMHNLLVHCCNRLDEVCSPRKCDDAAITALSIGLREAEKQGIPLVVTVSDDAIQRTGQ
jgi:hypothetical protein